MKREDLEWLLEKAREYVGLFESQCACCPADYKYIEECSKRIAIIAQDTDQQSGS